MKEKIYSILFIISMCIIFPVMLWGALNVNRWSEWFTFESVFEPYTIIGYRYIPVVVISILVYAYILFGGRKEKELDGQQNHKHT